MKWNYDMWKRYSTSLIVSVVCIVCYFLPYQIGFGGCGIDCRMDIPFGFTLQYFVYHFFHANIFHLLANLVALWQFHPRWHTLGVAYLIASFTAMLPFASVSEPTCGLSAMLFACYARQHIAWNKPIVWVLLVNLLLAFIPHLNWRIHLLAFVVALFYWDGYYCYRYIRGK